MSKKVIKKVIGVASLAKMPNNTSAYCAIRGGIVEHNSDILPKPWVLAFLPNKKKLPFENCQIPTRIAQDALVIFGSRFLQR